MDSEKERIKYKSLLNNPSQEEIDHRSYHFALFCANIKKFLPNIKHSEYLELFKQCLYYKWLSGIEQFDMNYLKESMVVNQSSINLEDIDNNQHLIFASFHFGSYRLYNSLLYEKGYKIVIIIDDNVFKQQGETLLNDVAPLIKKKATSDLIILNVKDRASIFKLKQLINDGYVMSVYLDGNTGLSTVKQDFTKGCIAIPFLDSIIHVKNGIGKLAAMLGAVIIPTISKRDTEGRNVITFHKEIRLSDFKNKQEFAFNAVSKIYEKFEGILVQDPMQWTSWLSIHHWFKRDYNSSYSQISTNNLSYKFNLNRYILFKVKNSTFIFDLLDYKSYPIDQLTYDRIKQEEISSIDDSTKLQLITKNIII